MQFNVVFVNFIAVFQKIRARSVQNALKGANIS